VNKNILEKLYSDQKMSAAEIATHFNCSQSKINYWLCKYNLPKRSISEALYLRHNPNGDPFTVRKISCHEDAFIFGLGLGLYWGEGNKKNGHSIRLGNTDVHLILSQGSVPRSLLRKW